MRDLYIMQGVPGSGKSTIIKKLGIEHYTVSSDAIRLLFDSVQMDTDNGFGIPQFHNKKVFRLLNEIVETRMHNGALTIIDATHVRVADIERYKKLAKDYRYRVYVVQFDVQLEELMRRDKERGFRKVGEDVILRMYNTFKEERNKMPKFVEVISPEEFESRLQQRPMDLSGYSKIHHIGDIHGCNTVLQSYLMNDLNPNHFYIFHGDLLDRGIENAKVLKFMMSIQDKKNVIILKGNHELHLENYANGKSHNGKSFNETAKEIELEGIDKKDIRVFCRKLSTLFVYTYGGKTVLCTHGGLPSFPKNIRLINEIQFVKGVGGYDFDVDSAFAENEKEENIYQIHGHRNKDGKPIFASKNSFNLEGNVEHGGSLRCVTLSKEGFECIEIKNTVFKLPDEIRMLESEKNMVEILRADPDIKEKRFGNISSFNFNKEVFFNQAWNQKNIKARGLFINTNINKITCRGYEKFFNINERAETKLESIKSLKYPINGYLKENGYLGLVGYNEETNDFVFASKSSLDSEHSTWLKTIFFKKFDSHKKSYILKYMKDNNVCLVFEVIDIFNSPHIIQYEENDLILLDVLYRTPVFSKIAYKDLVEFGSYISCKVKEKALKFNSFEAFAKWYEVATNYNYKYKNKFAEGFVFEDQSGFMFKTKLGYYNMWKHLRTVKDNFEKYFVAFQQGEYLSPKVQHSFPMLNDEKNREIAIKFIKWLSDNKGKIDFNTLDIITLRNQFEMD